MPERGGGAGSAQRAAQPHGRRVSIVGAHACACAGARPQRRTRSHRVCALSCVRGRDLRQKFGRGACLTCPAPNTPSLPLQSSPPKLLSFRTSHLQMRRSTAQRNANANTTMTAGGGRGLCAKGFGS